MSIKRYGRVLNQRVAAFSQQKLMASFGKKTESIAQQLRLFKFVPTGLTSTYDQQKNLALQICKLIEDLGEFKMNTAHNMERGKLQFSEQAYSEPLPLQWAQVLILGLQLISIKSEAVSVKDTYDLDVSMKLHGNKKLSFGLVILSHSLIIHYVLYERKAFGSYLSLVRYLVPTLVLFAEKFINVHGRRALSGSEVGPTVATLLEVADCANVSEEFRIRALLTGLKIVPTMFNFKAHKYFQNQSDFVSFITRTFESAIRVNKLLLEDNPPQSETWISVSKLLTIAVQAARQSSLNSSLNDTGVYKAIKQSIVEQGAILLQCPLSEDILEKVKLVLKEINSGNITHSPHETTS